MDKPLNENETVKLANDIRDLLGKNLIKYEEKDYASGITSCLIALCIEVGRLRFLATSTNEVKEDDFDKIFWEAAICHFNENKRRFEGSGH